MCQGFASPSPDLILGQQEQSVEFDEGMRAKVREVLLKNHHHQNEKKRNNLLPIVRSFADVSKKQSDLHLLDKPGEGSRGPWHQLRGLLAFGTRRRCLQGFGPIRPVPPVEKCPSCYFSAFWSVFLFPASPNTHSSSFSHHCRS